MSKKTCIAGLDFGTTSLSVVVINIDSMRIEKVLAYNTNAYIDSRNPLIREQSVGILTKLFYKLLDEIDSIPDIKIAAFGFTGQMHGIVGLNDKSKAITNLVTWEDKSGEITLPDGDKILDKVKSLSGNKTIANGYGIVTLYKWFKIDKREDICNFCTIADYFAGLLAGRIAISPTMAHSIGLFDIRSDNWMEESIKNLGLETGIFPEVVAESSIIGYTNRGSDTIPVVSAMGDNQASFSGSVADKVKSALINVGTGAQVSVLINRNETSRYDKYIDGIETQLRPYDANSYLMATSFVNGGSVYRSLFNFFKETGDILFNLKEIDENALWKNMEKAARDNIDNAALLKVSPLFEGQRKDPERKGEITNITSSNFRPGIVIAQFLTGLAEYYKTGFFPELLGKVEYICGSGNGLKRNKLLVQLIENTFGKHILVTSYNEEAAVGAALNAAKAIGLLKNEEEVKNLLLNLSNETRVEY